MNFKEKVKLFFRSFKHSFSYKKILFVFPFLWASTSLTLFFKGFMSENSHWLIFALAFVPVISSALLFWSSGLFLAYTYSQEIEQKGAPYWSSLFHSLKLLGKSAHLSLPVAAIFLGKKLVIFAGLGFFYLFEDVPIIGSVSQFISWVFPSFVVIGISFLATLCLFILFFITPPLVLKGGTSLVLVKEAWKQAKLRLSFHFLHFGIALLPILFSLLVSRGILACFSLSLCDYFFLLPFFCLLLAPSVIFFFHFAVEHYWHCYGTSDQVHS